MSRTHFSSITSFFLLLSVLATLTTAFYTPLDFLTRRQANTTDCAEYSTIANLSIVGGNATYRSAYLAASPEGGDPGRKPLDDAIPKLPALQFDSALNDKCGNLTEIAISAAETNFTSGIVLQFNINSAAQIGASAMGMAVIMAVFAITVGDIL